MWLDLELSGARPKPLQGAVMATIDQHRALLHGSDMKEESHSFAINLKEKVHCFNYSIIIMIELLDLDNH